MTIKEYGTGVGYEGFVDYWTNLDIQQEINTTIGNHVGRMINWLHYDVIS